MKSKNYFWKAIPALMAVLLVACGQSSGPSVASDQVNHAPGTGATTDSPVQIGLVMKTLTNPFFVEMEKGARRAEKEFGVNLQVKTAAQETSIEQQIQLVNDLIAAKVNAIVIAPGDSQSLVPVLGKAVSAGIKVVNIDNRLDPNAVKAAGMDPIPFISVDNAAGAYKAGKYLVDGISTPTEAAVLEGIRSADNARMRSEGVRRAFAENKNIALVASETANWKVEEAYTVTKKIFRQHPNVKLLFAANDMMALGAAKYLQETGNSEVKVAGYDALNEALAEIKRGHMVATVDQQAAEQGYQGVVLALRMIRGEKVAPDVLIDTRLLTAGTL